MTSETAEPLLVMCHSYSVSARVVEEEDFIVFGDVKLRKDAPVAFRKSDKEDWYTVFDIFVAVDCQRRGLGGASYMREARSRGATHVPMTLFKGLYKWLSGETDVVPDGVDEMKLQQAELSEVPVALDMDIDYELHSVQDVLNAESTPLPPFNMRSGRGDFTQTLKTYAVAISKRKRELSRPGQKKKSGTKKPKHDARRSGALKPQIPIIVVPVGYTAMITIHNIKLFLEEKVFVPSDRASESSRAQSGKFVKVVVPSQLDPSQEAIFLVVDDVSILKKHDWERVVAVFALGKAWQFRDWPTPYNEVAHVFDKFCGIYIYFDDEKPTEQVQSWRVTKMAINKIRRYHDASVVTDVWKLIYKYIQTRQGRGITFLY